MLKRRVGRSDVWRRGLLDRLRRGRVAWPRLLGTGLCANLEGEKISKVDKDAVVSEARDMERQCHGCQCGGWIETVPLPSSNIARVLANKL